MAKEAAAHPVPVVGAGASVIRTAVPLLVAAATCISVAVPMDEIWLISAGPRYSGFGAPRLFFSGYGIATPMNKVMAPASRAITPQLTSLKPNFS